MYRRAPSFGLGGHRKPRVPGKHRLAVTVYEARRLMATQRLGQQDPYVVVSCGGQTAKTQYISNGGENPDWGGVPLDLDLSPDELLGAADVQFSVRNKNILVDALIGDATVPLGSLEDGQPVHSWFPLYYKGERTQGRVRVQLRLLRTSGGAPLGLPPALRASAAPPGTSTPSPFGGARAAAGSVGTEDEAEWEVRPSRRRAGAGAGAGAGAHATRPAVATRPQEVRPSRAYRGMGPGARVLPPPGTPPPSRLRALGESGRALLYDLYS